MKKVYMLKKSNFANVYGLAWTTPKNVATAEKDGWERISRRDAEKMARAERQARKEEPNSSGYAPVVIMPMGYDERDFWEFHDYFIRSGLVVEMA